MGCYDICPTNLPSEKMIDWQIEDPSGKSIEKFHEIREIIRENVLEILKLYP